MTVLFKVPPQEIDGDVVALEAPAYGPVAITRGDRVFLWWSETQGGAGLVGEGLCVSAQATPIGWRADVEVVTDRFRGFGKTHLRHARDDGAGTPLGSLAAKLYRHSHNKVVAITAGEERFLSALLAGAIPPSA